MKESEERYKMVIQNIGAGITIFNLNLDVVIANKVAAKYLNITQEEYVGKNIRDFFPSPEKEEYIERQMCGDVRVFNEIQDIKKTDKSFTERGLFGLEIKYKQSLVRETYLNALAIGMMRGLEIGSVIGQEIDITNNCKNPRHKEFYEKFLKLAKEYNCAIVYHPRVGMKVADLNDR